MANTCNAEPLEGRRYDLSNLTMDSTMSDFFSKTKTLDRFLIICKGHKWMTHKTRLSSEASPTLETWFDLCYDDGPRDFIDLKEDNPDIVDHFVSYLYSGNYDDLSTGLKYTLREPRAGFVRTESVISLSSTDTSDCSGDENLQSDGLSEMDFLMASMAELGSEEANCTPPELDLPLRLTDGGLPALDSGPSSSFLGGVVTPRSSNSPQSTAKEDMVKQNMMENPNEDKAAAKLLINAKVYEFAEKYEIPKLKDLSWEKFELNLALGCRSSKFPNIIRTVYYGSSPPSDRGLRDLIMANSNVYMTSPLNRGEFYQLIKEGGDFALDLFHKFIPVAEQVELNTCQTCKELKSFDHTCSWCSTTIHNCVECNAQTLTRSKCPMCNPFELICPTCNTQSPWRISKCQWCAMGKGSCDKCGDILFTHCMCHS
ncbi:MAG: hypothetical protein M1834_004287 [Cirrosporium novae-zelandiae]|nr:MAG: hypothetical protein M1834_004287 [Cirrosporium novae-zelandiae]